MGTKKAGNLSYWKTLWNHLEKLHLKEKLEIDTSDVKGNINPETNSYSGQAGIGTDFMCYPAMIE